MKNIPPSKDIKIVSMRQEEAQRTYSNHVEVSVSPYDVSLKFCDLKPPSQEEITTIVKEKRIKVPVLAEIVLPHKVAEKLAEILKEQIEKFKQKGTK